MKSCLKNTKNYPEPALHGRAITGTAVLRFGTAVPNLARPCWLGRLFAKLNFRWHGRVKISTAVLVLDTAVLKMARPC